MALVLPFAWETWLGSLIMVFGSLLFVILYASVVPDSEVTMSEGVLLVLGTFIDEMQDKTFHIKYQLL